MKPLFFVVWGAGWGMALSACTTVDTDHTTRSLPTVFHTRVTFEPLDREKAQRYLEAERHVYQTKTKPLLERQAALSAGRRERYEKIQRELPECGRQRHCLQNLPKPTLKTMVRFSELAKEINTYDLELAELEASIRDWKNRYDLRSRAILNRHLVHSLLRLPEGQPRFQRVLVYSLESFETRKQLSQRLLSLAGENLAPSVFGDYQFRMLGLPVDEAAVIATFEVSLTPQAGPAAEGEPRRYVVSMLVNTHQLDLRHYEYDFLGTWGKKFAEPFQNALREEIYCGLYSIASESLAPRLAINRTKKCGEARSFMQSRDAAAFQDRFAPERWLLPITYYPLGARVAL